jgi:hypothetical protein
MHKLEFTEQEIKERAEQVLDGHFLWEIEKRKECDNWNIKIATPRIGWDDSHGCSGWRSSLGLMEWLDGIDLGITAKEEAKTEPADN